MNLREYHGQLAARARRLTLADKPPVAPSVQCSPYDFVDSF
jgi:hypothetical protein